MYTILRSFLFLFNPEWVHYFSMNCLQLACRIPFKKAILKSIFQPKGNHRFSLFDLTFSNRVGLGAGFDKNARYLSELEMLGFGFVEIGTVTPKPQAGNDKPRLFRLPKDKALINRMGFNNDGVEAIAKRLKAWREKKANQPGAALIIGGNIGKNKITPNEAAWQDYNICFTALHPYVDYFVVNVSSPNTPGLRELQEKASLHKILTNLQLLNVQYSNPKPILLKIAPDLTSTQVDDVIALALEIQLDGLVVSNTTINREALLTDKKIVEAIGAGGVSGLPVKQRSNQLVQYIAQKTNRQIPIIASGGIFNAADAQEKIQAGATLVQVWTGFIYEGPSIVKNICRGL
ncbi:MAG TPA: quinone-dependent dihydroorotate dehydrogenase [Ferruginibacter sp.]|nr:quinone-dependent dihydroorotate dehydrogenase [Ferruginibacter sp.]HMP19359.1 quinone-dependent dihydroorotate dehydrogenase [Ferruginibacter sp.]